MDSPGWGWGWQGVKLLGRKEVDRKLGGEPSGQESGEKGEKKKGGNRGKGKNRRESLAMVRRE